MMVQPTVVPGPQRRCATPSTMLLLVGVSIAGLYIETLLSARRGACSHGISNVGGCMTRRVWASRATTAESADPHESTINQPSADPVHQVPPRVTGDGEDCELATAVITGNWPTGHQPWQPGARLGNVLCMMGMVLLQASSLGGALEIVPPGTKFFTTSKICVEPAMPDAASPRAPVLNNDRCYTPCECGGGDFLRYRYLLQRYVLPVITAAPMPLRDPETLVIHVRSGDVMTDWPGVKFWQPGLAYYKRIIEAYHPNSPIRLITAEHGAADGKTGGNPVVKALLRWRPSIVCREENLATDMAIILGARYFVQGISTFSETLAIMSPHLRRTYIPKRVPAQSLDSACCHCRINPPRDRKLEKTRDCGADRGWPQPDGRQNATLVEVLLPGYHGPGVSVTNFSQKAAEMLNWDSEICFHEFS